MMIDDSTFESRRSIRLQAHHAVVVEGKSGTSCLL